MIRKATMDDIKSIHTILKYYGDRGELLARPLSKLYDHVRDFLVYESEDRKRILGCCAVQFFWEDLAEIRSLAVDPGHTGKGIGTALVKAAFIDAREYKIRRLFTLTYRPGFFERLGFKTINRSELPLKIWADCIHCVKYPDCDETAMMKELFKNT